MKPAHSIASVKLYPAPNRDDFQSTIRYARACQKVEARRMYYDQSGFFIRLVLRMVGGVV